MKADTISLRRRHLLIAGAAAPATLFAAQCGAAGDALAAELSAPASGSAERLVVSGRILGGNGEPLAGALVEALHAGTNESIGVSADADGRFMFMSTAHAETPARAWPVRYRVSYEGRQMLVNPLEVAHLQRDDAGTWRGTFGVTLA